MADKTNDPTIRQNNVAVLFGLQTDEDTRTLRFIHQ